MTELVSLEYRRTLHFFVWAKVSTDLEFFDMNWSFWSKRTLLEKVLALIVATLLVALVLTYCAKPATESLGLLSGRLVDEKIQRSVEDLLTLGHLNYQLSIDGVFLMDSALAKAKALDLLSHDLDLTTRVNANLSPEVVDERSDAAVPVLSRKIRINDAEVIVNFGTSGHIASASITDGPFGVIANVGSESVLSYSVHSKSFTTLANFKTDGTIVGSVFELPAGRFVMLKPFDGKRLVFERSGPSGIGQDAPLGNISLIE